MKTNIKKGTFVAHSDSSRCIVQLEDKSQIRAEVSEELSSQARPGFPFILKTGAEVANEVPEKNPDEGSKIIFIIKD